MARHINPDPTNSGTGWQEDGDTGDQILTLRSTVWARITKAAGALILGGATTIAGVLTAASAVITGALSAATITATNFITSAADAYSSLWYHGPQIATAIGAKDTFYKFTGFENAGCEDPNGEAVADPTTDDDITIASAGTFRVGLQSTFANDTAAQEMLLAARVVKAAPKAITDATNATPIVVTSVGHGLKNGDMVTITGVAGNTAANVDAAVAGKTDDTFELTDLSHADIAGTGAYTSGGTIDFEYPGSLSIGRKVSLTDLGRGASSGCVDLAAGDKIETAVANNDGTGNLQVAQMNLTVERIQ